MFKRLATAILIIIWAISPAAGIARSQDFAISGQTQDVDAEAFRMQAESLHKLALFYIQNGAADKGLVASRQILQSRIPPKYEEAVVESVKIISGEFEKVRRFDNAQALLDDAFKAVAQVSNQVDILLFKSVLYMNAGDNKNAVETYKRAQELRKTIK